MTKIARGLVWILPLILFAAGLRSQPVLRALFGVREVSSAELRHNAPGAPLPVLLDVRSRDEFERDHIAGALSVPLPHLDGYLARAGFTPDRPLVTVCERGYRSVVGAAVARAHGQLDVRSLAGGMVGWRTAGLPVETGPGPLATATDVPPQVPIRLWAQVLATANAFVVKPVYMSISLLLVVWLWRKRERDVTLLRRGFAAFFLGELACAINVLTGFGSDPLELAHDAGMVAGAALLVWGVMQWLDDRVLGFSGDKTCTMSRFCRRCWKRDATACGLYRLMWFGVAALALLALIPLSTGPTPHQARYDVLGTMIPYGHTVIAALVETRLCPLMALWLLAVAAFRLRRGREGIEPAKGPLFGAVGCLGFSLFRFFLVAAFSGQPFLGDAWEELTELAAISGLGLFLFLFRGQLGLSLRRGAAAAATETSA